jgi:hypothetical protein
MNDERAVDRVPLAEAIDVLRDELTTAMQAGGPSPLRFAVDELELELEVAMSRTGEGHGGIKFWLVDFGAKTEYSEGVTHRIRLNLRPIDAEGRPINLGDVLLVEPSAVAADGTTASSAIPD